MITTTSKAPQLAASLRQYDSFHCWLDRRDHFSKPEKITFAERRSFRLNTVYRPRRAYFDRCSRPRPPPTKACIFQASCPSASRPPGRCAFEHQGDAQWRRRGSERCVTLSYTDTLPTELAGSTTPAAATLFVASRLRMRWSELGGWSAEVVDTRLHLWGCKSWNWSPHGRIISGR